MAKVQLTATQIFIDAIRSSYGLLIFGMGDIKKVSIFMGLYTWYTYALFPFQWLFLKHNELENVYPVNKSINI